MSLERIRVEVPGAPYDVVVGEALIDRVGEFTREVSGASAVALITDQTVAACYGMAADTSLARAGFRVESLTVPAGETSKSWAMAGELLEVLAERGISRTDLVVALGGGVIGDLAGFVSAVYQRGIPFVQVPTTLLAMVDSSVGGKTAVDLRAGKNMAGAFHQPLSVIADTSTLSTLPDAEWRSGLAEVVKSAVLSGEEFVGFLERESGALVARDARVVREAVRRSAGFKARVVALDERESGARECLNLGHTLGHALEKVLGYGTLTHGAAVAEGMRFAARVAVEVLGADPALARRQDRLLDAFGLPAAGLEVSAPRVLDAMRADKKSRAGAIRMVLVSAPGVWRCVPVDDVVMVAHLEQWVRARRGE